MPEYLIRKATLNDTAFLTEVIIGAEKSGSDKFGLSTLFNLTENELQPIINAMFEEEIDDCEFSVSSFLIAVFNGQPVAAIGGWVEGHRQNMKSAVLKSNLIGFCFPKDSIVFAQSKLKVISEILIEREFLSLQIEYVYIDVNHRGKGLGERLIKQHIVNSREEYKVLKKAQVQVFSNNTPAIRLYERCGFHIEKEFRSENRQILDYMPHNKKLLMELNIA